jgi:Zn-dependent peptidase ImmA (M78 family)
MDKVEKILEKYKIHLGVKDVKLVVRLYKTRSAFTNLSSPPTIYLNKHLIDDEEVVEYLLLREMVHIALHRYPQMRYGTPNLSYSDKFDSALRFFMPEEKEEKTKEKIMKKLEINRRPA